MAFVQPNPDGPEGEPMVALFELGARRAADAVRNGEQTGEALVEALLARCAASPLNSDAGGRELLLLACECLDRAVALRAIIDAEGMIVRTRTGLKDHPLLRHELANRALVSKLLVRLGLDMEASPVPPSGVGRPPNGGIGVTDPEPFR